MSLVRNPVTPSLSLLETLRHNQLQQMMPTGFRWFGEESLKEQELNQLLVGWSKVLAPWEREIETLKHNLTLVNGTFGFLDVLGEGYGIPRQLLEPDDTYASRIQQELLVERVTRPAILAGLLLMVPYAELYEPWRDLAYLSENLVLSGSRPFADADYHNAATFDAILWATRGDVPGIADFIERMKAYGVKGWYTIRFPDQFLDFNDDPLIAPQAVDFLGNGLQDPRTVTRPSYVVTADTELITEDISGNAPGFMLSSPTGTLSGSMTLSQQEDLLYELWLIMENMAPGMRNFWGGDIIRPVALDRFSPDFATIEGNGFLIGDGFSLSNLQKNAIIETDLVASEVAGTGVVVVNRTEFMGTTQYTNFQAPADIRQVIALGDPDEELGGDAVLGEGVN